MQAPGYTTTPSVAATGMMTEALPPAVHAEHVAGALRRSGALGDGRVRDVVVESSRATIVSQIIRLRLFYDGAAVDARGSIILKTGRPDRTGAAWNAGRQEVAFYAQVAAATAACLFPRCFEAFWDAGTNA